MLQQLAVTKRELRNNGRLIREMLDRITETPSSRREHRMNEHDIRVQIHDILNSHDAMLLAIRTAAKAHDDAIVSAIEANRAALKLLNRMMDEGIEK